MADFPFSDFGRFGPYAEAELTTNYSFNQNLQILFVSIYFESD